LLAVVAVVMLMGIAARSDVNDIFTLAHYLPR
jgi:hypothetical protein